MEFLNSKQRKEFFSMLAGEYGYDGPTDFVLFNGGQNKVYVVTRDIEDVLGELKVRQAGLYIARVKDHTVRLSMDGAIFFGEHISKRVQLSDAQRDGWMAGESLVVDTDIEGFALMVWDENVLGCGLVREGEVLNFVPKGRRIHDPHDT